MYYRYCRREEAPVPEEAGYGIFFTDEEGVADRSFRGYDRYVYDGRQGVPLAELRPRFLQALSPGNAPDYMPDGTGEDLYGMLERAGVSALTEAWGQETYGRFLAEEIRRGEAAVILRDGAVLFEPALAEKRSLIQDLAAARERVDGALAEEAALILRQKEDARKELEGIRTEDGPREGRDRADGGGPTDRKEEPEGWMGDVPIPSPAL